MAIAIKKELAQTTYASLVEGYARQRRPGLMLTCGESDCTQEYLVYYGPDMEDLLGEEIKRGHPAHIAVIALNEPVPRATQHCAQDCAHSNLEAHLALHPVFP
jgi:hypothetical protein